MTCLTPVCLFQAEAKLAAKRAARAEAREIRLQELERRQREVRRSRARRKLNTYGQEVDSRGRKSRKLIVIIQNIHNNGNVLVIDVNKEGFHSNLKLYSEWGFGSRPVRRGGVLTTISGRSGFS